MLKPIVVDEERSFKLNELFFSVTDLKGKILFGNETFIRISDYDQADLIGAPHNIIRHPDMPKTVFKIFWTYLQAGKPIGAYVKNLARDGKYYWVYAFAFPVDGGYMSIRLKPSSQIFEKVKIIYEKVLRKEDPKNLSSDYILDLIKAEGFQSYDDFMVKAATEELGKREEYINQNMSKEDHSIRPSIVSQITNLTSDKLNSSFKKISNFQVADKALSASINTLNVEFKKLSFLALNMTIMAGKNGTQAASISVVASEFSKTSEEIHDHLKSFTSFINETSQVMLNCAQCILSLKMQMSMVEYFVNESLEKLKTSSNAFDEIISNEKYFCELFDISLKKLDLEMSLLKNKVDLLSKNLSDIHTFTVGLEVIQLVGAIESSRQDNIKAEFHNYLLEMKAFVQLLKKSFVDIDSQNNVLKINASEIRESNSSISGNLIQLFESAHKMAS